MKTILCTLAVFLCYGINAYSQTFTSFSSGFGLVNPAISSADFNNDGYVDVLATGALSTGSGSSGATYLYQNNNGSSFTEVSASKISGLSAIVNGAVAWADYNRDGFVDFAVSGKSSTGKLTLLFKNSGPGQGWVFTLDQSLPTGVDAGSLSWADCNHDGDPDLFVSGSDANGNPFSALYLNSGKSGNGAFSQSSASFTALKNGSSDWADYNRDGWEDLLVTGSTNSGIYLYGITQVYTNLGNGNFSLLSGFNCNVYQMGNTGHMGNAEWGDYNNDGYADILAVSSEYGSAVVYTNNGNGGFSALTNLEALQSGRAHWGDYNNDGFLDVGITGMYSTGSGLYGMNVNLYTNSQGNSFSIASNINFCMTYYSDFNWLDFNNDGQMDLFVSGQGSGNASQAAFYKNNSANTLAAPPANFTPARTRQWVLGNDVLLYWDNAPDSIQNYNLYLGTNPGNINVVSPMASLSSGQRRITGSGNAYNSHNYLMENLPSGTYYWSVQGVRPNLQGSSFATQGHFTIPGHTTVAAIQVESGTETFCSGYGPTLKALSYPPATSWQWYRNGALLSGAISQTYVPSESGSYYASCTGNDSEAGGRFTVQTNTLTVNAYPTPAPPTGLNNSYSICAGQSLTLTAIPGANANSCNWYNNSTLVAQGDSVTITPNATTTYEVYSFNSGNSCQSPTPVTVTINVSPLPTAPHVNPSSVCTGDSAVLTAYPPTGATCRWYASNAPGAPVLYTGNTYTTPPLLQNATYYVSSYISGGSCESSRVSYAVTALQLGPPTPQNGVSCTAGSVILSASPGTGGNTCIWYDVPSGGQALHTGLTYNTPSLSSSKTYYVATTVTGAGVVCESAPRMPVLAEVNPDMGQPYAPNQTGYTTSPGQSVRVQLWARQGARGTTCKWYSNAARTNFVATGTDFLTPAITSTHTYYVTNYDAEHHCEGDSATVVKAFVQTAPARKFNPDQVYPVVSIPGNRSQNGVNLCTGDVITSYPVGAINAGSLTYTLSVQYNSRSAAITPYYTANPLGGLGWKMLDYPKMVYDDVEKAFFYLDGQNVYRLDTVGTSGNTLTLRADGDAYLLNFALSGPSTSMTQRSWEVTNAEGQRYSFNQTPQSILSDGSAGNIWNLSGLRNTQGIDSLQFVYDNSGKLTKILSTNGDQMSLTYSSNLLSTISLYRMGTSNTKFYVEQTVFTYGNSFYPNSTAKILTQISRQVNSSPIYNASAQWVPSAPPTVFYYNTDNYPGALIEVETAAGGSLNFVYGNRNYNGMACFPVVETHLFTGTIHDYSGQNVPECRSTAYTYLYENAQYPYILYNYVSAYPGTSSAFQRMQSLSTSFETGKHDPVFKNIDKDLLSKDQHLTGEKSYFFNSSFSDITLQSKKCYLNKRQTIFAADTNLTSSHTQIAAALDTVTVSYFIYQSHKNLDVTHYFYYRFFDAQGNVNGSKVNEVETENQQYGQWVQVVQKLPIPDDAVKFDFSIVGGNFVYDYDFYLDVLTISGAAYAPEGREDFYFYTGEAADSLRHLPNFYRETYQSDSICKLWHTGFEQSVAENDWLKLKGGDCSPTVTRNSSNLEIAYAGSAALRMAACEDGSFSKVSIKDLSLPASTARVKLAFRYSKAQIPGLQFKVSISWSGGSSDTTITLPGSYLIDPDYQLFFREISVPSGRNTFSVEIDVVQSGVSTKVNSFYIDNLQIACLTNKTGVRQVQSRPDAADPVLVGKSYCTRTLKNDFNEIGYTEQCYLPYTTQWGSRAPLIFSNLEITQSASITYTLLRYNRSGLPVNAINATEITDTLNQRNIQVTNRQITYAADLYPALGRDQLSIAATPAAVTTLVKYIDDPDWTVSDCRLTQWQNFSANNLEPLWAPWRTYTLTKGTTPAIVNAVVQGIKNNGNTVPPASNWLQSNMIYAYNDQRLPVHVMAADSVPAYVQYSATSFAVNERHTTFTTDPYPVAEFSNASPGSAFFYGFETYEKIQGNVTSRVTDDFAFSGENAAKDSVVLGFKFENSQPMRAWYIFSGWIMPQCSLFQVTLNAPLNQTGYAGNLNFPDSVLGKWVYFETFYQVDFISDSLTFKIKPDATCRTSSRFDDLRFSPVEGGFSAMVYDMTQRRVICRHGNNSQYTRYTYDMTGQNTGITGTREQPLSHSSKYFSRLGSSLNQYNQNQPNYSTQTATASGGQYYLFNDVFQQSKWTFSNTASQMVFNNHVRLRSNENIMLKSGYLPPDAGHYGLSFQWIPNFSGATGSSPANLNVLFGQSQLTLNFNRGGQYVSVSWTDGANPTSLNIKLPASLSTDTPIGVSIVFNGSNVMLWVNGILTNISQSYNASRSNQIKFFVSPGSYAASLVSHVTIMNQPTVSIAFTDGIDNSLQTQVVDGAGVIVEETLYDNMLRPAIHTKKVLLNNQTPGYISGFVTSFNWYTGVMQGSVDQASAYNDGGNADNGYFYYRTVFEHSPVTAKSAEFQAGKDFALRTYSNWEKAKRWSYQNLPEYISDALTVIGYTVDAVTIILDPEAAPEIIILDAANIIATLLAGSKNNDEGEYPQISFQYNRRLQNTAIKLPKANLKKDPSSSQVISMKYDFAGNRTRLVTPEGGLMHAAYDYLGRLRLTQNDLNLSEGRALYNRYDRFGRLTEEGWFSISDWNTDSLEMFCKDLNYPGVAQHPQATKKYYYDGNDQNSRYNMTVRGRLTSWLTYDGNGAPASRKDFTYDVDGNVVAESLVMDYTGNQTDTILVRYAYNNIGQVTKINYPSFNNLDFWVKYTYNALAQCIQLSTSTDANLAAYSYNPDGTISGKSKYLANGSTFPEGLQYNPPGWLTNIASGDNVSNQPRFFNFSISYNLLQDWWSGLWGQSYYNGNIASTQYQPGANSHLETLKEGYNYNEYDALDSYYSSYLNEDMYGFDFEQPENMTYDVNGNITSREIIDQSNRYGGTVTNSDRRFKFKYNSHNQPKEMDFYLMGIITSGWHFGDHYYVHDTVWMQHDAAGNTNLITYHRHNSTDDNKDKGTLAESTVRTFTFNDDNLLQSGSFSNSNNSLVSCDFSYDPMGMRLVKTTNASRSGGTARTYRKTYIRDALGGILCDKMHPGTGNDTMRYYVRGADGNIEAMFVRVAGNTQSYFVLSDHLGSARQLVSRSDKSIVSAWAYNEYGLQIPDLQRNATAYPYLFTGQEYDPELGVYNYNARVYDPWLTQFLSPDPALQAPGTPYAYVANNPVNFTDPTGMMFRMFRNFFRGAEEVEEVARPALLTSVDNVPRTGRIADFAPETGFTGGFDFTSNEFVMLPSAAPGEHLYYNDGVELGADVVKPRNGGHQDAAAMLDNVLNVRDRPDDVHNFLSYPSRDSRGGFAMLPGDPANPRTRQIMFKSGYFNDMRFADHDARLYGIIPDENVNFYRRRVLGRIQFAFPEYTFNVVEYINPHP